jgi:hypothetical protein
MEAGKLKGIALRSSVISPHEIVKLAKVIDQSAITHLFIPDIGQVDSIEISAACLGVSKGLRVGSGVFRLLEHDSAQLLRRLLTIQAVSENRYLLGVGTGSPGQNPAQKIADLLKKLDELRSGFAGVPFPESYIATLRQGIATKVAGKSDGLLLNFCPPKFASTVVEAVRRSFSGQVKTACYLKVFFSASDQVAKKLAIEEFVKYDLLAHYHEMFEKSGLSEDIRAAARSLQDSDLFYSEKLANTCPVNPSQNQLRDYESKFREAGIVLPVVYPYFSPTESFDFKLEIVQTIISASD